jgi:hypothetical protein
MSEVNKLSAAAFEAIALAQSTYGVPDLLIAKIAQCSDKQITRNRKLVGWSLRKVPSAYLRGQAPSLNSDTGLPLMIGEPNLEAFNLEGSGRIDVEILRAAIDRLLLRLTKEMAVEDVDELDTLALKRIEAIGNAAKQMEKLVELREKLGHISQQPAEPQQKDPTETARVLKKIEKRVHQLAERRARDIINGTADGRGGVCDRSRVDDQRT